MSDDIKSLIKEFRDGLEGVTPGPWQVYDGCSWRRIGTLPGRGNYDCAVIAPTVASDGHPDLTCSAGNDREANLAHIARCSPENIAKLLDAAESSLASPAGMEGWMPIETAPKDGTPILVYFTRPSLGVQRVFFGDLDGDPVRPGEDGMWLINDNKHGPYPLRGYSEGDDSHWMPLPAAPRGEAK